MPNVELNSVDLENVKRGLESLLVNLDTDPRMEDESDAAVAAYSLSLQGTLAKVEAALNAR